MQMSSGKALSEKAVHSDKKEDFADGEGDGSGVRRTEAHRAPEPSYLNIESDLRLDE